MTSNLSWNSKSFGRVGVLMGGWSSERPISLKSGGAVLKALEEAGCEVIPLDLKDPALTRKEIEEAGIDIAFIALHGFFGEDGGIQTLLDGLKIPYTGSAAEASRRAMNKVICRKILSEAGIPMPEAVVLKMVSGKWVVVSGKSEKWFQDNEIPTHHTPHTTHLYPFPWVVKPSLEGSSVGITIVDRAGELSKAVEDASRYSKEVIVERYIQGRELTVGILQDQPLPVVEIIPKNRFYDYESKYTPGTEYLVPAPVRPQKNRQIQEIGLKVHQILECRGFSRVDMKMTEQENVFVLELNTIPGLTDKSLLPKAAKAAGISFTELCIKILESALVRID